MADYIRPTPRNPILGLLADAMMGGLAYMEDPRRTQQMRGVGGLLSGTGIAQTVDRLASGEPLTKGKGFATRMKPETAAAAMTLAPEAVPIGRAAMAAARATKGLPVGGAIVYHGSPYRFDRFDPTKIGSGEGSQAYGYGHYVAQAPDVARSYQSALSADRGFSFEGKPGLTRAQVQEMVDKKYGPGYLDNVIRPSGVADSFIDDMVTGTMRGEGSYPRQYKPGSQRAKIYDELRGKITHADPGSLYTIDLPDPAIARMLDWDKPLSQQAQAKAVLDRIGKEIALPRMQDAEGFGFAYQGLANAVGGPKNAAELLRNEGIPGIRYLDRGSRGASAGIGTSNFVVFPGEEDLLRILSVNGGLLGP